MKKKRKGCGTFFLVLIAILFVLRLLIMILPMSIGTFSLSSYSEELENKNFQVEKNYGKITGYITATKAGKRAFSERFEETKSSIFEWRGCSVRYDESNDAWCVYTFQFFPLALGGGEVVILESDGDVLAIWGEK